MRIRLATIQDARAIADVSSQSWRAAYPGIIAPDVLEQLASEQGRTDYWEAILRRSYALHYTFIAQDAQGQVLGCASCGPERNQNREYKGELYSIYLLPSHQRQGIGRALMGQVACQLIEQGMTSMLVCVLTDNHAARRFYERLGGTWLYEGGFNINEYQLPTVVYGWKDVRMLSAFAPPGEQAPPVAASVAHWMYAWRRLLARLRRHRTI